ncbi:MAG: ribose 5-phosphate isomerase B [Spirochaetota bacterium]|nr:ribose 5-phosphate isomerase B [Spirochaetota bacterium]
MKCKIALGSDHAGYLLKEAIKTWLENNQYEVIDFGTNSEDSVDYIDFVYPAAKSVVKKEADFAIVLCGTGLGASYVANKVHGIRAALCQDEFSTELSKLHNNANVLVLGGRVLAPQRAINLMKTWLKTEFEGVRHQKRIDRIHEIELLESNTHKNDLEV